MPYNIRKNKGVDLMPTAKQINDARNYLIAKENKLKETIIVTENILDSIGDYYKQNELQRKRRDLLVELQQIDQTYAPKLAGLEFNEEALENIANLAEYLWNIDDQITVKMQESKDLFRQAVAKAGEINPAE